MQLVVKQAQRFTEFDGTFGVCLQTECGRTFIRRLDSLWSQLSYIRFFEEGNGLTFTTNDERFIEVEMPED